MYVRRREAEKGRHIRRFEAALNGRRKRPRCLAGWGQGGCVDRGLDTECVADDEVEDLGAAAEGLGQGSA